MDGKQTFAGTLTLASPGDEAVAVSLGELDDDYILTGWIDLSGLDSASEVTVCLRFYVVPGQQSRSQLCASYSGALDAAPLLVKPMYMPSYARAEIAVRLERGGPVSLPYWIAVVKPDIGVKAWLMRRFA